MHRGCFQDQASAPAEWLQICGRFRQMLQVGLVQVLEDASNFTGLLDCAEAAQLLLVLTQIPLLEWAPSKDIIPRCEVTGYRPA